jgi:hypothetical protein
MSAAGSQETESPYSERDFCAFGSIDQFHAWSTNELPPSRLSKNGLLDLKNTVPTLITLTGAFWARTATKREIFS